MPEFDPLAYIDAWRRKDLARILDMHADDAVVEDPMSGVVARGKEYLGTHMGLEMPIMESIAIEPRMVFEGPDKVSALVKVRIRYGRDYELPGGGRMPLAGKETEFDMGVFLETDAQGRIAREVWTFDVASTMDQLGIPYSEVVRMEREGPLAEFAQRTSPT